MQLENVRIQRFQNFTGAQDIEVEPDVTCFVGKNESGKTSILKALHRLNPANGTSHNFRVTPEYPMARLAGDRRTEALDDVCPVSATFRLGKPDQSTLLDAELAIPAGSDLRLIASRSYGNRLILELTADLDDVLAEAADVAGVHEDDLEDLRADGDSTGSLSDRCKHLGKDLRERGEAARAKAVGAVPKEFANLSRDLRTFTDEDESVESVRSILPRFFYFSDYDTLPGTCDLSELSLKIESGGELDSKEQTVVALLEYAGESPTDFLDEDYVSRKAELQAAGTDLSSKVFEYWKQNRDLSIVLDTDMPVVGRDTQGHEIRHRILRIELRDERHGGVETNFETRSAGFQWFFSFLAAFSKYQDSDESVVVLLDEPGTRLHGEAQRDFLRFIHDELGQSKQVFYTTHSQHMIDPARYEKLRAVHDRATRDDNSAGVVVTEASLAADRDTVLPIEAAIGYNVAQHLFIGSGHHLIVEGSSDFVYLQRMSDHLLAAGRSALDPRLAILPVGSADNMPPFVALLGRRMPISVLIDGSQSSRQHQRIRKAAEAVDKVDESSIVLCSSVDDSLPNTADIEDLFDAEDYLWLYSETFTPLTVGDLPETNEPILRRVVTARDDFDHALPAHTLTAKRDAFFAQVRPGTLDRFEQLFTKLNATLGD